MRVCQPSPLARNAASTSASSRILTGSLVTMAFGLPSPQPFTVEHLPVLAAELQRIHTITYQVQDIIRNIEAQAIKRIFRKGEVADLVLADIKRQADADMAQITEDISKMPAHLQRDHVNLLNRAPHYAGVNYGVDEKPGYFSQNTQGAAA